MRFASIVLVGLGITFISAAADAQVYKYKRKDGTVTYTDSLSDLPQERQRYYADLERDREQRIAQLKAEMGEGEYEKKQQAQERAKAANEAEADAARAAQRTKIDARLRAYSARKLSRNETKRLWSGRMTAARAKLKNLLAEFKATDEAYRNIAMRPAHTLFPGQAEKRDKARVKLERLEKEIDDVILEIQVVIPTAARKASIPPGWIR